MNKRKIFFYADSIYTIGGIETWLYNLTSVLKDYFDVLVLYRYADQNQLNRLEVPYEEYNSSKRYRCDILITVINGKPYSVKAGHVINAVHANYALLPTYKYSHWGAIDSYIFASEAAFRHFTGPRTKPSVVLSNPLRTPTSIEKPQKNDNVIRLLCASRFTAEKGGHRLYQLCSELENRKIPYEANIYSTWDSNRFSELVGVEKLPYHMFFHSPQLDITNEMLASTYVVQLSDCESFCYTIHEALQLHVPVLVTNWDGVKDVVRNGLNGYIYSMDMDNVDYNRLRNPPHTFGVLKTSNREWIKYLSELPLLKDPYKDYNYFL